MSKEYQTIIDKDNKYVVVVNDRPLYSLGHCSIPELYSMESTLEGIDRYYHNTLMEEFKEMGCKLKTMTINE